MIVQISILLLILLLPANGAYENTLIIELGNSSSNSGNRNNLRSSARDESTANHLISRIQEVKELVLKMDQVFTNKLDKLHERITRLESNQKNVQYMMSKNENDWRPLTSTGKKIRVFTAQSSWAEAEEVCKAHTGKLLLIDSEIENRRVTDYLQNYEQNLYWIGVQATISFAVPAGKYHNFDGGQMQESNCAALSTAGKWNNNDCNERHGFICQFNYV